MICYKITIIVKGNNELKNDIENGFVEKGIAEDVFPDEEIVEFQAEQIPN